MQRRILVKGTSGSGKSTLGRALARHLGVPFVELDALHHGPDWRPASAAELQASVSGLLDDSRGWVVDGNYDSKLGDLLLDRAELIVWLDLPLRTVLWRLTSRTTRRFLTNEILWNGNRETLKGMFWGRDALFAWAVKSHFRHRRLWPSELAMRRFVRLRTPQQVETWFRELCSGSAPSSAAGPARAR